MYPHIHTHCIKRRNVKMLRKCHNVDALHGTYTHVLIISFTVHCCKSIYPQSGRNTALCHYLAATSLSALWQPTVDAHHFHKEICSIN